MRLTTMELFKHLLFGLAFLLGLAAQSWGACTCTVGGNPVAEGNQCADAGWNTYTINAAATCITDGSADQVNQCIDDPNVLDGCTLSIPAGSYEWEEVVEINEKIVTLAGAGYSSTTVVNKITTTGSTDSTIRIPSTNTKVFRITGINFTCDVTGCQTTNSIFTYSTGTADGWRIDANKYTFPDRTTAPGIWFIGLTDGSFGLFDGNYIDYSGLSTGTRIFMQIKQTDGTPQGTTVWAADTPYGTADAIYVENNQFVGPINYPSSLSFTDGEAGGKLVFRYNTITNGITTLHGFADSGPTSHWRGVKTYEIYNNLFSMDKAAGQFAPITLRSGSGFIYDNVFNGNYNNNLTLYCFRAGDSYYDQYTAPYKGEHDGLADAEVLTDTSQAWTVNAFVDYRVNNTTDGSSCAITSNTATTLTCAVGLAGGTEDDWDIDDHYQISKYGYCDGDAPADENDVTAGYGWKCRDCVGAGTDTGAWPSSQANTPTYLWDNYYGSDDAVPNVPAGDTQNVIKCKTGSVCGSNATHATYYNYIGCTSEADCTNNHAMSYTRYTCPHPLTGLTPGTCMDDQAGAGTPYTSGDPTPPAGGTTATIGAGSHTVTMGAGSQTLTIQ